MQCIQCRTTFPDRSRSDAAISIFVMGDEYIYSYWFCGTCQTYTVERYHDRFMGEDDISYLPPISKEVGDRCVDLVRACPRPYDKNCNCASHRALYHGVPGD